MVVDSAHVMNEMHIFLQVKLLVGIQPVFSSTLLFGICPVSPARMRKISSLFWPLSMDIAHVFFSVLLTLTFFSSLKMPKKTWQISSRFDPLLCH